LEDLGVDLRILLRWILKKKGVKFGLDSSDSRQGSVAGSFENSNDPSGYIKKGRKFLDQLSDYQLVMKCSAQ
jgi:hypothetical protein